MSDHDNDSPPPVLPQHPQYLPRPSGAGRWMFMFLFFALAGLLLMGGWFLSSIGEVMDSLAAPTDVYTETIVRSGDTEQRIAIVPVTGVITSYGLSAEQNMVTRIKKQFDFAASDERIKAVVLRIDSPGGEVLASDEIHNAIVEFQSDTGKPVIASMGGMAASGGYWLAASADEIYASNASVIGSIGVISAGFGFPDVMEKLGIERRVYTSGKSKSMLDPFRPENVEDVAYLKSLQSDIHEQFIDYVRHRRGTRLNGDEEDLFSGRFWTGSGNFHDHKHRA